MAVRNASFEIAAFDAEAKPKDEHRYIELAHGGGRFSLWRPVSQGRFAKLTLALKRNAVQAINEIDDFLRKTMLEPDEVRELAEAGEVDMDGNPYAERLKNGERPVGPTFLWDAYEAGALLDEDGDESVIPIYQMIAAVMKAATGFPTAPSSASTPTPKRSGPTSTATSRRQGSTRSTSRRAGSPA